MLDVAELLKPSALADAGIDGDVPCEPMPTFIMDFAGGVFAVRLVCKTCGDVVGEFGQGTLGDGPTVIAARAAADASFTALAMQFCPVLHGDPGEG